MKIVAMVDLEGMPVTRASVGLLAMTMLTFLAVGPARADQTTKQDGFWTSQTSGSVAKIYWSEVLDVQQRQ